MKGASGRSRAVGAGDTAAAGTVDTAGAPSVFRPSAPILPARLAARSGGDSAASERSFESLLELCDRTAGNDGFPANDPACALEYFVVNTYMTYHDLHDVPYDKDPRIERSADPLERLQLMAEKKSQAVTSGQERAVYRQFQDRLAADSAVAGMSDREKQEMAELLAITMGVTYTAYTEGVNGGDDGAVDQARRTAGQQLEKVVGVPVARIRIGDGGLEQ